jgi:hypothetical protein
VHAGEVGLLRVTRDNQLGELQRIDLPVAAGMASQIECLTRSVVDVLIVKENDDPCGRHAPSKDKPRQFE